MYCPEDSKGEYVNTKIIRLTIFLIAGACAGFPALFWALGVLYRYYKGKGRVSPIVVSLLLSDLLELILIPFLISYMFQADSKRCGFIFKLVFGVRLCGHLFHQVAAVEIISQRYPSLAKVFSPSCSIVLCVLVFLPAIGCQFIEIGHVINMFVCGLPLIVCAVTYLLTWKAPHDNKQKTDRKPGVLVITVAMFTLVILYMPFFLTVFTDLPFTLDTLASMRLISDPLLCVLVCRELDYNVQ